MEIELSNSLVSWLIPLDPANLLSNWFPGWFGLPETAAAGGAAAGGLGLSNLFGPDVGGTASGNVSPDYSGRSRLGEPVNPDTYDPRPAGSVGDGAAPQSVPPGNPPPMPYQPDRSDPEGSVRNVEDAREDAYENRRTRHPEDTTAAPPQAGATDGAGSFFHTAIVEGIKRQ